MLAAVGVVAEGVEERRLGARLEVAAAGGLQGANGGAQGYEADDGSDPVGEVADQLTIE